MLYYMLYQLRDYSIIFNVFRYITFRAVLASVTAFLICIFLGKPVISWLSSINALANHKRHDANKIHQFFSHKQMVPTMGGVLVILSIVVSNILWGDILNSFVWLALIVVVWFGLVGFVDDYIKIAKQSSKGLQALTKLTGQLLLGIGLGLILYYDPSFDKTVFVPFFKNIVFYLGVGYIPFVILIVVGSSNALNLTDGLDGLAVGCLIFAAAAFALMSYLSGNVIFSNYLQISYVPQTGELAVFCASLIGASVGFLWYNSYPANVFLGDTGALSLGGVLGAIAIFIKQELVLLIVGGIFVWEAFSVILQVLSFKLTKKRLFLMSPFHHHLQLKGWPESKVTVRFWIISFILALIGLSTLKLR